MVPTDLLNARLSQTFNLQRTQYLRSTINWSAILQGMPILLSAKKKWAVKPWKTWRALKYILLSERSQSKKAPYYMIPTMTFWKRQNYGDSKKITGCQRLGRREGWTGRAQRILGQWNYSVWHEDGGSIVIIHFSKPIECTIPRSEP